MSNVTIKVIVTLVSLLFLNIEAAQAGLITRLKGIIRTDFPESHLIMILVAIVVLGFLLYVIFTPLAIGSEKWNWYRYFSYNPYRHRYHERRAVVKRIADTLGRNPVQLKAAGSISPKPEQASAVI
jgi:hypothetical protein